MKLICSFSSLAVVLLVGSVFAEDPNTPLPAPRVIVPVAMYDSAGVGGDGPRLLEETFAAKTEFRITRITAEEIRAGKLKGYKALIVPGGLSQTQGNTLGEDGRDMIRAFVREGNSYVGICAGCYLASSHYKWSLGILPVKVVDSANWGRGIGDLRMELTSDGKEWLTRKESTAKVHYHNGPVLEPIKDSKEKLIPLALYKEEMTRKGAKEGLMKETPAIAAARYGKGWAVGISPHPEQSEGLQGFVPSALRFTLNHPLPNETKN
ncbi:BPL-N domain-containing protein [Zavarzinella formosa]|uniref:BPL-N domain-containing protein n=1 Tax=Zavarzinella formosa TaxID=360055 RepID=UPI0002E49236|nr:BPL-N domain-containing protein [Zavarzinella formosa]